MKSCPASLSRHAAQRAVQRSIPLAVIDAIHAYGSTSYHCGAVALRLDRRALDLARDDLPARLFCTLARFAGAFIVVAGDVIVTVCRPTRRLWS